MLYLYLSSPATWLSVLMPALICVWALTTSPLNRQQWKTFLVCTALSFVSARWELKADVEQLFIIPVMLVCSWCCSIEATPGTVVKRLPWFSCPFGLSTCRKPLYYTPRDS